MIEHISNTETPEPEGDHIPPGTPTQVAHPWRATLRTIVQTLVAVSVGIVVLGPPIIDAILFDQTVPDGMRAALLGVSAVVVAIGGIATRVMSIPGVNDLLIKVGLGTGVEKEGPKHRA